MRCCLQEFSIPCSNLQDGLSNILQVDPREDVAECGERLCWLRGSEKVLCAALQEYADDCQAAGVSLDWRTPSFCRKSDSQ